MSINRVASVGVTSPEAQEMERMSAVMRKARDIQQSQADSPIALVRSARPDNLGQNIDLYA